MVAKRRPINNLSPNSKFNFRPTGLDQSKNETKGTRPTTNPTTVKETLLMLIVHVCKKTLFYDINIKLAIYMGTLFIVSVIGDFAPFPKTYFSRSDNLFNVFFVKMGWAWTLAVSVPYVVMTARVICCGDVNRLLSHHVSRILIATGVWFVFTKSFNYVENAYGRCNVRGFDTKPTCLKGGHFWNGFDISGHIFILMYSSFVLIEEARPIVGWENIKEHIRNEEHNRLTNEKSTTNPLRNLKDNEFQVVKYLYEQYTPYTRLLFIAIAVLQLLWDFMMLCTMLYFHKMIEKVLGGMLAITVWFITYRVWYPANGLLPQLPGRGLFNYQKKCATLPLRKRSVILSSSSSKTTNDAPNFMGMPLYAAHTCGKANVEL